MLKSSGIRDSYKTYRENSENPVKLKTYLEINDGFIKFFVSKLMEGDIVKLPERLGTMEFVGKKVVPKVTNDEIVKGLAPNWKATHEYWKQNPEAKKKKEVLFHFNEATNGIRYKIRWSKKHAFVLNKEFYIFVLSRRNKRKFASLIKQGVEYFVESKSDSHVKSKES